MLEEMVKQEGRSPQSIIEEALVVYFEYKYGSPNEQDTQDTFKSAPIDKESGNQSAPVEKVSNNSVYFWDFDVLGAEESIEETPSYDSWDNGLDIKKLGTGSPLPQVLVNTRIHLPVSIITTSTNRCLQKNYGK